MAGKQVPATSEMTFRMALGVKGLLMPRSDSFVVCAFRSFAASCKILRGSGALAIEVWAGSNFSTSVERKRWSNARVEDAVCMSAFASSDEVMLKETHDLRIVGTMYPIFTA